eukprot:gnl/Hemi2/26409_TR8864_c0_g1_i1.p1 gnl/Hemi2/26409_TR8864_c0_g1~~gnl/Hemi2/26409_TR8864_c0_g1_i1.p1  ORF type:complete len:201 (+),score=56.30 gnl/Hemi2/26409_TR8864_c0_g1_i1:65-604(+)
MLNPVCKEFTSLNCLVDRITEHNNYLRSLDGSGLAIINAEVVTCNVSESRASLESLSSLVAGTANGVIIKNLIELATKGAAEINKASAECEKVRKVREVFYKEKHASLKCWNIFKIISVKEEGDGIFIVELTHTCVKVNLTTHRVLMVDWMTGEQDLTVTKVILGIMPPGMFPPLPSRS